MYTYSPTPELDEGSSYYAPKLWLLDTLGAWMTFSFYLLVWWKPTLAVTLLMVGFAMRLVAQALFDRLIGQSGTLIGWLILLGGLAALAAVALTIQWLFN